MPTQNMKKGFGNGNDKMSPSGGEKAKKKSPKGINFTGVLRNKRRAEFLTSLQQPRTQIDVIELRAQPVLYQRFCFPSGKICNLAKDETSDFNFC